MGDIAAQATAHYESKLVSLEQALATIRPGGRIYLDTGCVAPRNLLGILLLRGHSPQVGLRGAFVVSLLLCSRMLAAGRVAEDPRVRQPRGVRRARRVYPRGRAQWWVATVRPSVDAGLLAIALTSLVIGRGFAIQYARERVPEALWALPIFFTIIS